MVCETIMRTEKIDSLNPAQRAAVEHKEGPLLVLAGAGSGKTRVITHRIARLVERGVDPRKILAVTFTNKAAAEMRNRVRKMVGGDLQGLWLATFHSACARIIRISAERVGLTRDFTIYDANDQKRLMTDVAKSLGADQEASPKEFLNMISMHQGRYEGPEVLQETDPFDRTYKLVWEEYTKRLRKANAADFGDLLVLALQIIKEDALKQKGWAVRWDHILVDEFQDTNHVQYLLAKTLSQHTQNLCVVGDDDQSIYSWRGADVSNILEFEHDHKDTKVVTLEQNYRSTKIILDAAFSVIKNNTGRRDKKLWSTLGAGEPISIYVGFNERDEARYVAQIAQKLRRRGSLGDLAVFYRVHAQSRAIEEALREASIPYRMVAAMKFYDRAEIKDLISYMRFIFNPASDLDLKRIINTPKRGIGKTSVGKVEKLGGMKNITLYEALKEAVKPGSDVLGSGARKKVSSFISLMEGLLQRASQVLPSQLAEEILQRTGYVENLTHAKNREDAQRIENLMEMVGSIRAYEGEADEPSLLDFLERVALTADADGAGGEGKAVTLMTVHAAKGLEFPEVVVTGMEEGVFPHARGLFDEIELEEERRLAYVAYTRAKQRLYLTRTESRNLMGQTRFNEPARFLREIPRNLCKQESSVNKKSGLNGEGMRVFGRGSGSEYGRPDGWNEISRAMKDAAFNNRTHSSRGSRKRSSGKESPGLRAIRAEIEARERKKAAANREQTKSIGVQPERRRKRSQTKGGGQSTHWYSGMKVHHKKFGPGTVQAWYGEPPNQQISVYFFKHGIKTIISRFLEPI